jgi:hypothetical protein
MAELTLVETTTDACCTPEQQAACCKPSAKADCCGHDEGCGCDAGATTIQASDVRRRVRERWMA